MSIVVTRQINAVAYAQNGAIVAAGYYDGRIKLWNPTNGRLIRVLAGFNGVVVSTEFANDSLSLISGTDSGECKWWDIQSGNEIHTFPIEDGPTACTLFSPDNQYILVSSYSAAKLYHLATKQLYLSQSCYGRVVGKFMPSTNLLILGDQQGYIYVIDLSTMELINDFPTFPLAITSIEIAPNNEQVFIWDCEKISVWKIGIGKHIR